MEKLKEIKKLILKYAAYYQQTLDDTAIEMYADVLSGNLTLEQVSFAFKSATIDQKITRFPLPAALIAMAIGEKVNEQDEAVLAANAIESAIRRHGYNNPEDAKKAMPEIAWLVCEYLGGWASVCSGTTEDSIPTLKAQWRELAKSLKKAIASDKVSFLENNIFEFKRLS